MVALVKRETNLVAVTELSKLMAHYSEPRMLCRALTHNSVLFPQSEKILGVQLIKVKPHGDLVEVGFFGQRPLENPELRSSVDEGGVSDAFRAQQLHSVSSESDTKTAILAFGVSYPVGALVFLLEKQAEVPELGQAEIELLASLGALYLSDSQGQADLPFRGPTLSPRQRSVLTGLSQGLTNQEIANQSQTSLSNIRQTTVSLYAKLGVKSRDMAVAKAKKLGLLEQELTSPNLQS